MTRYFVQDTSLTAIADAIRAKTGGTAKLTLDGMAQAVAGIETGGGGGGFPNGTEWTQSNVTSGTFYKIYSNGSVYVAGGSSGLWYSTDGMTWTQSNITKSVYNTNALLFEKGVWLASSSNSIYYSTDGMTWTQSNLTGTSTKTKASRVVFGNGLFVASASTEIQSGLFYSTDGMTWTQSNLTFEVQPCVCTYEDGVWIAGTYSSGLWYSTDGMTWTQSNITSGFIGSTTVDPITPTAMKRNGTWVALAGSALWYSTDGMTWTQSNITATGTYKIGPRHANKTWLFFSQNGAHVSADGITWTVANQSINNVTACEYLRNMFYVRHSSYLYRTADGTEWEQTNAGKAESLAYGNGVYACYSSKSAMHSTNGASWEKNNLSSYAYRIYEKDGMWIAATNAGIYYSPTWLPSN